MGTRLGLFIGRSRLVALIVLIIGIASIALAVLAQIPAQPKPFMTFRGQAYEIDYYNASGLPAPTLVIHGTMNGAPVPFSVSLFAITPTKIYAVGYYYGVGTVSIGLASPLIMNVADTWISDYGGAVWPSLIAFITYGVNNETWTVITAIPYNPAWVVEKRPIEISVNAKFDEMKPTHVTPLSSIDAMANTQMVKLGRVNGSNDPFGFTYIGSCSSSSNVAYPPTPSSSDSVSYVWELEQCSEFEGGVPLVFIGWSSNALQQISSIDVNNIEGTAQSGSGLFGVLNESGINVPNGLVLVGPTYEFGNTYTIEMPNNIVGAAISYGPLNEETSTVSGMEILQYTVPSGGFFYVGLPSYVAYVAFQEYEVAPGLAMPTGYWANGTESLAPLESDFNGQYLYVYPYLDVGNGSMTGVFDGVVYMYKNYGQLLINLLDAYEYNQGISWTPCSNAPQPGIGTNYIEYTLSSITSTYNPNPIGWAFMFGSLLAGGYFGDLPEIVDYVITAAGDALTIVSAFVNTALFNQNNFGLSANVYIYYYPSSTFYVTFIGSPQVTSTTGSQSLYPMGMMVNASGYYPSWLLGARCNS
ncbi:hypothetical protein JCM16161A_14000 [Vulcanisaeta sp. JCM 16161]|uniref:hypothetical protein n=1 Tax=Vulcanisaeta sp. JCM 16161 TaxID=1295372 RepID=UPI001FB23258|nr:hypothetical protein [Vulcanisaeta sp. JCM 16161]